MDKMPSRRHLALIAWYWTPHKARFEMWLRENGKALATLARGEKPKRENNPAQKDRPHAASPAWYADYPDDPFSFPTTDVKNAQRRLQRESRETGFPYHITEEIIRRGWKEWKWLWANTDRSKMMFGYPHEHGLHRLREFQRGVVKKEDLDLYKEAMRWVAEYQARKRTMPMGTSASLGAQR
jgi:hypothetical protein